MRYYLGLDNGGTTTKAALFDERGRECASASVSTPSVMERPGFVERDMDVLWEANCSVTREVIERAGVEAASIACVGVCGHGKGLYLWGKDGRPTRMGIASTDDRARDIARQWRHDGTEAKAFELSCQHVMSCQPPALLAWLKRHEPASYENIQYVFECKDYVRFRLTGEARAELTDYSGAGLMNLHTGEYDERLLSLFGIEEVAGALPPLCRSDERAGVVSEEAAAATGLAPGTPVCGGLFDIDACALASGVVTGDLVCMIAGTWSINAYMRRDPVVDGSVAMNSLFCLPGSYLVEESSATSAGNNEWFVRTVLPDAGKEAAVRGLSAYDVVNEWVGELSPETDVPTFLPFLMGSNVNPRAMGAFVGMSAAHTRSHLARAVYEGIAFCHRAHYERLLSSRDAPPRAIRLSGGAARSEVWAQLFADVMGAPVETVDAHEVGALGCAIACSVAAGDARDLPEAAARMVRVGRTFVPRAEATAAYERKWQIYRSAVEHLDAFWNERDSLVLETGLV